MAENDDNQSLSKDEICEEENEGQLVFDPVQSVSNEFFQQMLPTIVKKWNQVDDFNVAIEFKNGNVYIGQIDEFKFNGLGVFKWPDGTVYEGSFCNNYPEGLGKLTKLNNEVYEGNFKRGVKHGKGLLLTNTYSYSGSFENGNAQGCGEFKRQGFTFTGNFSSNKMKTGIAKYQNGIYIGDYDDFGRQKFGKFIFKSSNDLYEGSWYDDKFHDFGIYEWNKELNHNKFILNHKISYSGYWLDGKRHGVGILKFKDATLMCLWELDKKHGPGIIIAANGEIFISNELFFENQYKCSWKLQSTVEAQTIVKKLLTIEVKDGCKFFIFDELDISTDVKTKKEKFCNIIANLMEIVEYKSEIYPMFLSNFNFPLSLPYLDVILNEFYSNSKYREAELKSLNQTIVENLDQIREIFCKYSTVFQKTDKSSIYMPKFGLWLFYRDVFLKMPKLNVSSALAEAEKFNQIMVKNCFDAFENVNFWEFLRHVLHIVRILDQTNGRIHEQLMKEFQPNYGYLATMFMVFLREFKEVENFHDSLVVQMIQKSPLQALKLFKITETFYEDTLTFRSIYRFFKKSNEGENFLNNISGTEFFECCSQVFPNILKDEYLVETTFDVTPLEFWEIILICSEKNILNRKLLLKSQKILQRQLELEEEKNLQVMSNRSVKSLKKKKKRQ